MNRFRRFARFLRWPAPARTKNAPPPNLGYIDALSAHHAMGWGYDPATPARRLAFEAVLEHTGEILLSGSADLPVPGLAAIGVGDGAHGFNIRFPRVLTPR